MNKRSDNLLATLHKVESYCDMHHFVIYKSGQITEDCAEMAWEVERDPEWTDLLDVAQELGPAGQALRPPAAVLTSSKVKGAADAELFHTVQNRKTVDRHDSLQEQLSGQQIHDVVAYIRSLGR